MGKKEITKILAIDTSCDETSASITEGFSVISNVIWSQSKIHAKYGGVVPSTARREHERKIEWVVNKAVNTAKTTYKNLSAVSVTIGPGLAIALGVGIDMAKNLSDKYQKPLIAVNHLEGHLLSSLSMKGNSKFQIPNSKIIKGYLKVPYFPAFGIVASGGNTLLVSIEKVGKYKVLAQTIDDALGESLDKSARLLGLGYPGGAVLEKFARLGDRGKYTLPIPMLGRENKGEYSYSGIKTAFIRLYNQLLLKNKVTKKTVYDLAASYQKTAFDHFFRVTSKTISLNKNSKYKHLFVGGGVAANTDFRRRTRFMCKRFSITPLFPYSKKLYGDNAAMIGIAAYFKYLKNDFIKPSQIDRVPDLKIDDEIF